MWEVIEKHKKSIIPFLNSSFGKEYFKKIGLTRAVNDCPIIDVFPNGVKTWTGKMIRRDDGLLTPEIKGIFFVGKDIMQEELSIPLTKLNIANNNGFIDNYRSGIEHYMGYETIKSKQYFPKIYLLQITPNTNAGGDGCIRRDGIETWATCVAASSGTSVKDTDTTVTAVNNFFDTGISQNDRGFWPANTSAIGAGAIISAFTFGLYVNTLNHDDAWSLGVFQSTQASGTALGTGDYNKAGSAIGMTAVAYTSLNTSAMNTFNMNSTAIGWINKTGYTMLATRGSNDYNNVQPGNTNGDFVIVNTSDNASNKPIMTITYSIAGWIPFFI